uniref:Uncharacterized protein n=1 Tax=Glossina palpalis gambiensis TaxID=67801 RepID=A0A1B0BUT2_9MUSC
MSMCLFFLQFLLAVIPYQCALPFQLYLSSTHDFEIIVRTVMAGCSCSRCGSVIAEVPEGDGRSSPPSDSVIVRVWGTGGSRQVGLSDTITPRYRFPVEMVDNISMIDVDVGTENHTPTSAHLDLAFIDCY